MKSNEKGNIALTSAIHHYAKLGYQILTLVGGDYNPYDLAIEKDGKFLKIQCKYTSLLRPSGKYVVDMRVKTGGRRGDKMYKPGDFDLLYVMCSDQRLYEIPFDVIHRKTQLTFTTKYFPYQIGIDSIH